MSDQEAEEMNMPRTCPQCQAPILETQRFCRYCGCRLGERLQEDEQTKTFEQATVRIIHPGRLTSEQATLSPPLGGETMPLRTTARRSRVRYGVFALLVLSVLGTGIAFYQMNLDGQRDQGAAQSVGPESPFPSHPARPTVPVPPSPWPLARPAPPKPPALPAVPPNVPDAKHEELISTTLLTHAALTEQKIALLRKRLDSTKEMTAEERVQLLHEISKLEQERMAVLTAAQVLKGRSGAIENLLRGIIPIEEILKAVEAEQRKSQSRMGWKLGQGDRLTDPQRRELQNNVDRALRDAMKQLKQAQQAKDELRRNR